MQETETILAEDLHFQGRLTFTESVFISGRFKGQIDTKGTLTVGEAGHVEADIVAGSIVIYGYLQGSMVAHREVEIKASGHLVGNIVAPFLTIERGAKFIGNSSFMKKTEKKDS